MCFFFDQVYEKDPHCNFLRLHLVIKNGKAEEGRSVAKGLRGLIFCCGFLNYEDTLVHCRNFKKKARFDPTKRLGFLRNSFYVLEFLHSEVLTYGI